MNLRNIRRLDQLGRITLPSEIRNIFNLKEYDGLEIYVEDETLILKKTQNKDIFSGIQDDLYEYKGKYVSKQSIIELVYMLGLRIEE